jgi:hypothetical protein
MAAILEIRDLRVEYRTQELGQATKVAVDGLNLHVQAGEVFGFLGPNGAGKTTTMNVLLGFVPPTSGDAFLFGVSVRHPIARQRIGYLPELTYYYKFLTAEELLRFYGRLFRLPPAELERRIDAVLKLVELEHARVERERRLQRAAGRLGRLTGEAVAVPPANAATNARAPWWMSAPVVAGYEGVSFAQLSGFRFIVPETLLVRTNAAGALLPQIPPAVLALDGRKVAVRGYMQPLQVEDGYAREFILARDPGTCCFGAEPQFNHYLLVRCVGRGNRPVRGVPPVLGVPITVAGTLRVGEHRQQGWLLGIYQLDAEDVLKHGP